jgi:O-antigen ligase
LNRTENLLALIPVAMALVFQAMLWRLLIAQRRLKRRQIPLAREGNPIIPFSMIFLSWLQASVLHNFYFDAYKPSVAALLTGSAVVLCLALSYGIYRLRGLFDKRDQSEPDTLPLD